MNIDLTNPIFHDEDKAREWFEATRWPSGVFCPHCGVDTVIRMEGKAHRPGLFHCQGCRGQFTVRTGQVMESSHVPLAKWALAFHLMAASKKGISAHQLHRTIKVAYNTAWFMSHRIREAMGETSPSPIGGEGKVVEVDEAYHGTAEVPVRAGNRVPKPVKSGRSGVANKRAIVALVERGGEARAVVMTGKAVTAKNVREVMVRHASRKSVLHTDESRLYPEVGKEFAKHEKVHHAAGEYARGKGADLVTTNTVEGFFGVFKRGFNGVYQHCGEQHFQRYVDEFTFRYNTRAKLGFDDAERAEIALRQAEGKRLTWRRIEAA